MSSLSIARLLDHTSFAVYPSFMTDNAFSRSTWGEPLPLDEAVVNQSARTIRFLDGFTADTTMSAGYTARLLSFNPSVPSWLMPKIKAFESVIVGSALTDEMQEHVRSSRLYRAIKGASPRNVRPLPASNYHTNDILRFLVAYGDDAFSTDYSAEKSVNGAVYADSDYNRVRLAPNEKLWALDDGDAVTLTRLSIAVRDMIWQVQGRDAAARTRRDTLFEGLSPITIGSFAYAIARYPTASTDSIFDMGKYSTMFEEPYGTLTSIVGDAALAWLIELSRHGIYTYYGPGLSKSWHAHSGMDFTSWLRYVTDRGIGFDDCVPFFEKGIFNAEVICSFVENDIDKSLFFSLHG